MPRPPPGWLWAVVPRLALLVGVLNVVLLLFGVGLTAFVLLPQLGLLLLVPLFLGIRPRFRRALWSAGTASWEDTAGGLARAGMLSGDGLILGRAAAPSVKEAAKLLIRAPPRASPAVADTFLDSLWPRKGPWVRMNAGVNAVAFLPSGKGKGSSLVIPNLLTYQGSVVALDPKGELARASASWRRDHFGNEVVILDPFGQVTDTPDRWNPLDQIDPAAPDALDLVRAVAEALVVRSGSEQEPHWNDGAESFIAALVAWVIHAGKPGVRDLQSAAELLASPKELRGALALMSQSKAHGGLLARMAHQLGHYAGEELGSVLTTTGRHLRFLATPAVVESTTATTFDPTRLRSGRMTIYLVLPTEYLRSHRALLRLWVSSLLRCVVRGGAHERQKVWFILDEAAALGHLECIDDAVTQMRGYGVRLLFMYQSLGQLRQCFPEGRDQTFLSNMDYRVYAGVNDYQTAELVSKELGPSTILVGQENGGWSRTRNRDPQGLETSSTTTNAGWSTNETQRDLLQPAEIMRLPERLAIVFAPNVRPVCLRLVRYFEAEFQTVLGSGRRLRLWLLSLAFLLVASAAVGLAFFALATRSPNPQQVAPYPPPPAWPQPEPTWPPPPAWPPQQPAWPPQQPGWPPRQPTWPYGP